MSVIIGMTSDDGIVVAGQGKTTAEALDSFVGCFDEDAQVAYAKAHGELADKIKTLVENYDPRGWTPVAAAEDVSGGDDSSVQQDGVSEDREAEDIPAEKVGVQNQLDTTEEGKEVEEGKPRCAVCDVDVGEGRAEVSEDEYGEVRCKQHSG